MSRMASVLLPVSALAFISWVVYMGGLASLQNSCGNDYHDYPRPTGLASVPCSAIYRLPWVYFVVEFIIIVMTVGTIISGSVQRWRKALLCSYSVALFLFISVADKMIDVNLYMQHYKGHRSWNDYHNVDSSFPRSRIQATTAGAIMISIANALAVLVLIQFSDEAPPQEGLDVARALPPQLTQPFPGCPLCMLCQGACHYYKEAVNMVANTMADNYKAPGHDMVAMEQQPLNYSPPFHQQGTAVGLVSVAPSHQQGTGLAPVPPAQAQYNPFANNDAPV